MWRWDQGRLTYFSLDKIRKIASGLVELDGADLNTDHDPLRSILPTVVGLPFKPNNYKVWRNYARVFKILGLASRVNNRLTTTDLCKKIVAQGENYITYDEYIHFITRTFYYPSPIFQGYDCLTPQIFPFSSMLKLMISRGFTSGKSYITIEDIASILIGNVNLTGLEPIAAYNSLQKTNFTIKGDQLRQVREMVIFLSQLSYLTWLDGKLFIDLSTFSNLSTKEIENVLQPLVEPRNPDPELEIQSINNVNDPNRININLNEPANLDDIFFTEGKKIRISHLRTERNSKVVRHYFQNTPNPKLCDACQTEVANRYPWLDNLIEVHHLLPLASPLHVERKGTSMSDLVGLCPNCHRATHALYRSELAEQNLTDFTSKEHARHVYLQVKSQYVSI